jgi:hypothetical protein
MEPAVNKFIGEMKTTQAMLDEDREQRGWMDLGFDEGFVGPTQLNGDVPGEDGTGETLERDVTDDAEDTEAHYDVSSRPSATGGGAK